MSVDVLKKNLKDLVDELKKLHEKEIEQLLTENEAALLSNEFENKLKEADPEIVFEFLLVLPGSLFTKIIEKFGSVISEKIMHASTKVIARIFDQLPHDLRKQFNRAFREPIMNYLKNQRIQDLTIMIYNISPPSRSGAFSMLRPVIIDKNFATKILETSLEDLEAFISVLSEDLRKVLITKQEEVFMGSDFGQKLKEASNEEIVNLLRWFPKNMYNKFIEVHKSVLEEKGLRLSPE